MFLCQRRSTINIQHTKTPADVHDANCSKNMFGLTFFGTRFSHSGHRRPDCTNHENVNVRKYFYTIKHLKCLLMPQFHISQCTCLCVHVCVSETLTVTLVNNFPVCGLFALLLGVSAETVVRCFGVKAQDLPLLMDPEREG